MFAAEVARGDLRRSPLNEFLETSRDASSQLVANLNRAAELIQSFKQVAADRNYSDQRSFDLGDLTEQVVMSLRPGLRKHHLTLNVDCQPNLTMNSYPGPYGQVLTNLFLNAVAHAFPDGRPGAVDIQVRESGKDNVEIIFSDNGCGMSLDVRRRAFDPFFTTRRDQGGTGLGLHIVYSIVTNRLGGRLDLDSEPGGGHANPDHPAPGRAAGAGRRIACADWSLNRVSASLRNVALKIWLALPTSAVPFMTAALSVKVPETPTPTGLGPPNSGLASGLLVWRWISTSPLKVSPFAV